MIGFIFRPLFFRKPSIFEYQGQMDDGIKLLAKAVKRTPFQTFFTESLVGKVTKSKVQIYRYRPLFHNSFVPVFYGRFTSENGKSALEGEFSIHRVSRAFILAWIVGILLLWGYFMFEVYASGDISKDLLPFALIPLGMAGFGVLILHIGWLFGKKDVPYIERRIQEVFLKKDI